MYAVMVVLTYSWIINQEKFDINNPYKVFGFGPPTTLKIPKLVGPQPEPPKIPKKDKPS